VKEGLYLVESGLSPYAGDAYHQAPLLLWFFSFFFSASMPLPAGGSEALTAAAAYLPTLSHYATPALFIFTDFFIAFLLMFLSQNYLAHPTFTASAPSPSAASSSSSSSSSSAAVAPPSTSPPLTGEIVFCVYLTNPWTILTCVAQSTIVFNNLAVVLCLYAAVKGSGRVFAHARTHALSHVLRRNDSLRECVAGDAVPGVGHVPVAVSGPAALPSRRHRSHLLQATRQAQGTDPHAHARARAHSDARACCTQWY
jgi:hypothetical protein